MTYQEILSNALRLSDTERKHLIGTLEQLESKVASSAQSLRLNLYLEKRGRCPHCGGTHYYRFGKDKGAQRFMCRDCGRTFTQYTGTWMEGLHKKSIVAPYMKLMTESKSLDKISSALHINKKTAFDWRHKILGSLKQDEGKSFSGITESDETFFDKSDKGNRHLSRKPHKRGGCCHTRGISKDKATVIATADRKNDLNMTLCGYGRLTEKEIADSLQTPLPKDVVLCTDGHASYVKYASENHLEHVVLNGKRGQHVKRTVFHIQHVNALHNLLKCWIDRTFFGVATKYLQNYLNWFKAYQTVLKQSQNQAEEMLCLAMTYNRGKFAMH